MNSFVLVIACLIGAVVFQYLLCRSDNILMGLIIPAVFTVLAVVISTTTVGNSMNKTMTFIQWILPALAALIIYFFAKKQKHDKRKRQKAKEAEKLLKEQEQLAEPEEAEVEAIEDAEVKQLSE